MLSLTIDLPASLKCRGGATCPLFAGPGCVSKRRTPAACHLPCFATPNDLRWVVTWKEKQMRARAGMRVNDNDNIFYMLCASPERTLGATRSKGVQHTRPKMRFVAHTLQVRIRFFATPALEAWEGQIPMGTSSYSRAFTHVIRRVFICKIESDYFPNQIIFLSS